MEIAPFTKCFFRNISVKVELDLRNLTMLLQLSAPLIKFNVFSYALLFNVDNKHIKI